MTPWSEATEAQRNTFSKIDQQYCQRHTDGNIGAEIQSRQSESHAHSQFYCLLLVIEMTDIL